MVVTGFFAQCWLLPIYVWLCPLDLGCHIYVSQHIGGNMNPVLYFNVLYSN